MKDPTSSAKMVSEHEFRAKLKNTPRSGRSNLPKTGAPGVTYGRIEPISLVESVKRVSLDLDAHAFSPRQRDGLSRREVPTVKARPNQVVDWCISPRQVSTPPQTRWD